MLDEIVPAGSPWTGIVRKGQVLRLTDLEGQQAVDFLCYNAADFDERYHAPNTVKAAGSIYLTTGHTLYSDNARPMFTIVDDQFDGHDTIGCCSSPHRGAERRLQRAQPLLSRETRRFERRALPNLCLPLLERQLYLGMHSLADVEQRRGRRVDCLSRGVLDCVGVGHA